MFRIKKNKKKKKKKNKQTKKGRCRVRLKNEEEQRVAVEGTYEIYEGEEQRCLLPLDYIPC